MPCISVVPVLVFRELKCEMSRKGLGGSQGSFGGSGFCSLQWYPREEPFVTGPGSAAGTVSFRSSFGSKLLSRAGVPSPDYSSETLCSVAINLLKYHLFSVIHSEMYPYYIHLSLTSE